ncbi:MAG: FAD-binding protein [Candidatus Thermoplasmatota archaeon]|nr:FAD-binding protein [Candidatus Thermoplasmatota archaeon]
MKVLVFAKQIPDVNSIRFDTATNRIVRENVPLSMNSFDRKAVEEAIRMKEKYGFHTVVASMGPPQAADILNESLKMGVDEAYLITDMKFGGSDTLATSRILAGFAEKIKPDIILAGRYSLDGETSQVPPEVATMLGYSFRSSVSKIDIDTAGNTLTVDQDRENGIERYRLKIPAVLSVSEKINRARAVKPDVPDMKDRVITVDSAWLGLDIDGKEFSPTVVTGTQPMENSRKVAMLDFGDGVYGRIMELMKSARSPRSEDNMEFHMPPHVDGNPVALGVAVGDPQTAMEIASRISQLAAQHPMNVAMIGNIPADKLSGIACHDLYYVDSRDYMSLAGSILDFIGKHEPAYIVFPANSDGRDVASVVAAKLGLGLTADCVDLQVEDRRLVQYKPAFGGSIIASIYSRKTPAMATVRPGMFRRLISAEKPRIHDFPPGKGSGQELIETIPVPSEYRPLNSSDAVIGIGRGIKKRDTIREVLKLADALNASVGATRPMVDMNFLPRQQQIGLTGMAISPAFYIALGISGQANHVVGIRYAGKVLAVNSDPAAEIFKYSDYGIVCDVNEFIEGFMSYLGKNSGEK